MKKSITTLLSLLVCGISFAQITVNSTDIPKPDTTGGLYMDVSGLLTPPAPSASGTWDLGTYSNTPQVLGYYPLTDTAYTNHGINAYRSGSKSFNSAFGYNIASLFSFNSSTVDDKGVYVPKQGYDISSFTSTSGDSLNIPAQAWIFTYPRTFMKFPFTYKSAWGSVSGRVTNFNLTVSSAKLKNAPCQHYYYYLRYDTIIGYGKMRVYTPKGKSPYYDVLIDQVSELTVDSFYVNGKPAPGSFLSTFGVSQGQRTDSNYRYNFIRKNSFPYLYTTYFGNNAFKTPQNEYVALVNVASGVDDISNTASYSVMVYPNPCNGKDLTVHVSGKPLNEVTYTVTDITGRTMQKGTALFQNGSMHLTLNSTLSTGNYILNVFDTDRTPVVSENIIVNNK